MSGIENKVLEFQFSVENIQFNSLGHFLLKLQVVNSFSDDYSGVRVAHGDSGEFVNDRQATTDVVHQEELKQFYNLPESKLRFLLPKGRFMLRPQCLPRCCLCKKKLFFQ